ncbi:MAG: hotdog fold thioesterase [Gammaproteobacteria bacterium]
MSEKNTIWFAEPSLETTQYMQKETLVQTLDIELTEFGPDYLRGTMPVTPKVHQPMGILHGGASVTLAETLGSVGAALTLDLSKKHPVGLEINANHIRPVSTGIVTGTARPLHKGRKTQVWEIQIHNDQNKLTCISRLTVAILDNY